MHDIKQDTERNQDKEVKFCNFLENVKINFEDTVLRLFKTGNIEIEVNIPSKLFLSWSKEKRRFGQPQLNII